MFTSQNLNEPDTLIVLAHGRQNMTNNYNNSYKKTSLIGILTLGS